MDVLRQHERSSINVDGGNVRAIIGSLKLIIKHVRTLSRDVHLIIFWPVGVTDDHFYIVFTVAHRLPCTPSFTIQEVCYFANNCMQQNHFGMFIFSIRVPDQEADLEKDRTLASYGIKDQAQLHCFTRYVTISQ